MKKITGHNYLGMVADEGPPALFGVRRAHRTVFTKVLADGAWGGPKGELQLQLVGDAFLTQVGFSAAISRISLRRSLGIRGLPGGRDFQRQRRRNPLRCQRMRNVHTKRTSCTAISSPPTSRSLRTD